MKLIEFLKDRKIDCEDTVVWVESALADKNMKKHKENLLGIRDDLHRLWHKYDIILKEEEKK